MITEFEFHHESTVGKRKVLWVRFQHDDRKAKGKNLYIDFSIRNGEVLSTSINAHNQEQEIINRTEYFSLREILCYQQELLHYKEIRSHLTREFDITDIPLIQAVRRSKEGKDGVESVDERLATLTLDGITEQFGCMSAYGKVLYNGTMRTFFVQLDDIYEDNLSKKPVLNKYRDLLIHSIENHPDKMRWMLQGKGTF